MDESELQHLYAWIDKIPLSRPKKNITRDFSDGVMLAEVVHHFAARLVELHNYSPASSSKQKLENWHTLNAKVFKKLGLTVPESVLKGVTNNKPGVVEVVLNNVRIKLEQYLQRAESREDTGTWSEGDAKGRKGRGRGPSKSPTKPTNSSFDILNGPPYDEIDDPSQALMEKDQSIMDYQETVEILQVKVRKLEQLVKLKDRRIDELSGKLERYEAK